MFEKQIKAESGDEKRKIEKAEIFVECGGQQGRNGKQWKDVSQCHSRTKKQNATR